MKLEAVEAELKSEIMLKAFVPAGTTRPHSVELLMMCEK